MGVFISIICCKFRPEACYDFLRPFFKREFIDIGYIKQEELQADVLGAEGVECRYQNLNPSLVMKVTSWNILQVATSRNA